ncbi:Dual-specificity RNA methyltransferase RlmN [Symbiodinium microadriaticum]|uniref:Dual-specificity RNA methyltransferase RlmN n=1 Tax=Symbiodinium microadriaticum TaxID=2951 RepID=A0A1Q9E7X0_SYMMI|nr:Dual-specificity RNA methyltransferase RlmN [Symbiodinium microadriaticum]
MAPISAGPSARRRELHPKPIFDEPALRTFLTGHGIKTVHMARIWKHVVSQLSESTWPRLDEVPGLPQRIRDALAAEFTVVTSQVVKTSVSELDGTMKLLIRLQAEHPDQRQADRCGERDTLCVSSQVGCRLGCTFCATGTMGLLGNLWPGEIQEQLILARRQKGHSASICNVVFMGMGEPLENFDAVSSAVKGFVDPMRFGLAPSSITVSTVGSSPHHMQRMLEELPKIRLAVSLHAPNQQLREELVPAAKAIPIEKLLQLVDNHVEQTSGEGKRQRTVMMSYVLLKGVNDSPAHAAELAALSRPTSHCEFDPLQRFRRHNSRLGIAMYLQSVLKEMRSLGNAHAYEEPSPQTVDDFLQILADSDIRVFERRHHGRDIAAACGQLAKLEGPNVCDIDIENAGCILNKDLARRPQAQSQGDSETPEARHWRTLLAGGVGLAILAAAMEMLRPRIQERLAAMSQSQDVATGGAQQERRTSLRQGVHRAPPPTEDTNQAESTGLREAADPRGGEVRMSLTSDLTEADGSIRLPRRFRALAWGPCTLFFSCWVRSWPVTAALLPCLRPSRLERATKLAYRLNAALAVAAGICGLRNWDHGLNEVFMLPMTILFGFGSVLVAWFLVALLPVFPTPPVAKARSAWWRRAWSKQHQTEGFALFLALGAGCLAAILAALRPQPRAAMALAAFLWSLLAEMVLVPAARSLMETLIIYCASRGCCCGHATLLARCPGLLRFPHKGSWTSRELLLRNVEVTGVALLADWMFLHRVTLRIVRLLAATAVLLVAPQLLSHWCFFGDWAGNLLLVARRASAAHEPTNEGKDRLQDFAAKHSTGARAVEVVSMDLAMDGAARELHNILVAADLAEKIDVLVLNAGAALSGSFVDADLDSLTDSAALTGRTETPGYEIDSGNAYGWKLNRCFHARRHRDGVQLSASVLAPDQLEIRNNRDQSDEDTGKTSLNAFSSEEAALIFRIAPMVSKSETVARETVLAMLRRDGEHVIGPINWLYTAMGPLLPALLAETSSPRHVLKAAQSQGSQGQKPLS